jgi:hypothetical protein
MIWMVMNHRQVRRQSWRFRDRYIHEATKTQRYRFNVPGVYKLYCSITRY